MIYGKIWCVVKPSVGIPLFLGAVAVSSFAVHAMLVTQTTWLKGYLNGNAVVATATHSEAPAVAPPAAAATKKP